MILPFLASIHRGIEVRKVGNPWEPNHRLPDRRAVCFQKSTCSERNKKKLLVTRSYSDMSLFLSQSISPSQKDLLHTISTMIHPPTNQHNDAFKIKTLLFLWISDVKFWKQNTWSPLPVPSFPFKFLWRCDAPSAATSLQRDSFWPAGNLQQLHMLGYNCCSLEFAKSKEKRMAKCPYIKKNKLL